MNTSHNPGKTLRHLVATSTKPLQVVGAINAYSAMLAKQAGHQAIYLSGGGVAAASLGMPDLGITTLHDVVTDAARITSACDLPLLVDIDVGWGGAFNIARAIRELEAAGVAGVHIEDQELQKRCGHRPNKTIVSTNEMTDRIKAAVDARRNDDFVIMARTDSLAVEGMDSALMKAAAFVEAGADMLFPEALTELVQYQAFASATNAPILANITEFGQTPLFTLDELKSAGVSIALYPLSAFRAMSNAALNVYRHLAAYGTQHKVVDTMQTRAELYDTLNYYAYEDKLDALFQSK